MTSGRPRLSLVTSADRSGAVAAYPSLSTTVKPAFLAPDRKSTRLNSSHPSISYAVFCLKKKISMDSHVSQPGTPRFLFTLSDLNRDPLVVQHHSLPACFQHYSGRVVLFNIHAHSAFANI